MKTKLEEKLPLRISKATADRIETITEATGLSKSNIARMALTAYLTVIEQNNSVFIQNMSGQIARRT